MAGYIGSKLIESQEACYIDHTRHKGQDNGKLQVVARGAAFALVSEQFFVAKLGQFCQNHQRLLLYTEKALERGLFW